MQLRQMIAPQSHLLYLQITSDVKIEDSTVRAV